MLGDEGGGKKEKEENKMRCDEMGLMDVGDGGIGDSGGGRRRKRELMDRQNDTRRKAVEEYCS